jgi:aldehyde:ferredoxin oxidoreductase
MCNRAGIDSISTGSTISFAIECYENGILTVEDTGGLELRWGDSDSILKLTKLIIAREGIGDLLADGSKRAAEKIGKGSEKYAIHAGGQELGGHDPKHIPSLGLSYSCDPTPGRHTTASINYAEMEGPIKDFLPKAGILKGKKGDLVIMAKNQRILTGIHQVINGLGLCNFSGMFGPFPMVELIEAVVGWKLTTQDILKIGWRIQTMRLAFSLREGINPYKNTLPERSTGEIPAMKGPNSGKRVDYKELNRCYYEEMGWDASTGIPTLESLKKLGLESLYDDISL